MNEGEEGQGEGRGKKKEEVCLAMEREVDSLASCSVSWVSGRRGKEVKEREMEGKKRTKEKKGKEKKGVR